VRRATGADVGFAGPVGFGGQLVVDRDAASVADGVTGANETDYHLLHVAHGRDFEGEVADIRSVVDGDLCPECGASLKLYRGIEVGHIFQLGRKYSEAMKATVLDPSGKNLTPLMGCYGIGVTRVVAAAIEQNHDDKGIIWPEPIAPFTVLLLTLNHDRSEAVRTVADRLYVEMGQVGIDVLYDDRDARPGVKFADAELLGIPHVIVIGDRGIAAGRLEYRNRRSGENGEIAADAVVPELQKLLAH
jgi:prolyl-tRNA synthetase